MGEWFSNYMAMGFIGVDVAGLVLALAVIGYYILIVRKEVFNTEKIVMIALSGAIAYILSMVKFIRLPQDGSISLLPMLPILIISFKYNKVAGMTTGIVYGFLGMLMSPYILTPVQFILEYLIVYMVVGCANLFGTKTRWRVLAGSTVVLIARFLIHFLAGVIYFGEYAGDMNVWLYSFMYNGSTVGIESILTGIAITALPLHYLLGNIKLKKINASNKIKK